MTDHLINDDDDDSSSSSELRWDSSSFTFHFLEKSA